MSMTTRTVPNDYNLRIEGLQEPFPYDSVITHCTLSSLSGKHNWQVVPFPYTMPRCYKLDFSLRLAAISDYIPQPPNINTVTLVFFAGINEQTATRLQQSLFAVERKDSVFNAETNELQLSFTFKIKDEFRSTKAKPQLLFIAAKIDGIVLKHLVCDMIVFSSIRKLSANGMLAIGRGTENILRKSKCFWFSDNLICTKEELEQAKQEQKQSHIESLSSTERPIFTMLTATQNCAKVMEQFYNKASADCQQAFMIQARQLIQILTNETNALEIIANGDTNSGNEMPPLEELPTYIQSSDLISPFFEDQIGEEQISITNIDLK